MTGGVELWSAVRFVHLLAMAFFVGGQLMLVATVVPAVRRRGGDDAVIGAVARRFGMGTGVALVLLIATGVAMAGHFARWSDPTLHVKLAVLALVAVLLGLHVVAPRSRALSLGMLVASLVIVWLGVKLAHG